MSQQTRRGVRPYGLRAYVLLVLTVLAGVVAMHGLGPVVASAPPGAVSTDVHSAAVAVEALAHGDETSECDCSHADDHGGGVGGHAEHADETCAASGTSAAPTLPALVLSGTLTSAVTNVPTPVIAATSDGRAPPSLSELQLLRI
ncbi:DUF6153 family protein [Streptomyces pristinaespiralis]|uniref:DUF6153 family protein n=1 Tax=Streptomyces pristinaespiralis TaxID=38300 RepID=UPI0033EE2EC3